MQGKCMEDFIKFTTIRNENVAVRKSTIMAIIENEDDENVKVITEYDDYETEESFDSIISKLTK